MISKSLLISNMHNNPFSDINNEIVGIVTGTIFFSFIGFILSMLWVLFALPNKDMITDGIWANSWAAIFWGYTAITALVDVIDLCFLFILLFKVVTEVTDSISGHTQQR